MDIKALRQIAQIFKEAELTELEISDGELNIKLKRTLPGQIIAAPAAVSAPLSAVVLPNTEKADSAPVKKSEAHEGAEIKAPLAGVFYASASPELAPYVKVGSQVKKGDILCIIEAMKVMNEINAERDGEIVEICASNDELVEYNQTLFRMK